MSATILIVDDEPHMLRVTELSLRKGGFQLLTAHNGREAVDRAREVRPALIVMDLVMPEMDGLAAVHELKSDATTAEIPVIMLTARGHVMTRQKAEEAGVAMFLTKPFSPSQLLAEARRLIGTATPTAPGPEAPT